MSINTLDTDQKRTRMKIEDFLVATDTAGDIKYSPCFTYKINSRKMGEKRCKVIV